MLSAAVYRTSVASEDDPYQQLLACVRTRFTEATAGHTALFSTSATGLFAAFLEALPPVWRQQYTCNACRRFVDRFGGLVVVNEDGSASPVLWDAETAPPFFRASVHAVARLVVRSKIDGVFVTDEKTWGLPQNESEKPPFLWQHLAVVPDAALVFEPTMLSDGRAEGSGAARGIRDVVPRPRRVSTRRRTAGATLLTTGQLYRSEKCIGVAEWLLDLHEARAAARTRPRATTRRGSRCRRR